MYFKYIFCVARKRFLFFIAIEELQMSTLFDQLGGQAAVDGVVETFYRYVLTDDRISKFFDDADMDRQIAKQKVFLTMAFGGPVKYSGEDMRQAHTHLVNRGLNDTHFDAVVEQLAAALKENGVRSDLISEVATIAESVREDVLNR